ncbi:hypothetical protein RhiLY_02767 [Ceratobasidium sp. AG-Ba]|nr:hypothetical protein RhiLY_02767 [Ceratobasidium sp. AG-Ba]
MSSGSPLESKVGEIRVVARPQHIEVDTNESSAATHPTFLSVFGLTLHASQEASVLLGGPLVDLARFRRLSSAFVVAVSLATNSSDGNVVPTPLVQSSTSKARSSAKTNICANFTVDIPPSLHPPYGGEYTYELVGSVTIVTTDAMGAKGVIVRTGVAEIDIVSKHSPVFINPLTPSGPGPWSYTRC